MEYYSAIKKEWNNAICSNIDRPGDYQSKWSKSGKRKANIMGYCLYAESKIKIIPMNLITKQKQTHRLQKQTYCYQRGQTGGEISKEFGIDMYILLYMFIHLFYLFDSTYKWNCTVFIFLWFISLSIISCRSIHAIIIGKMSIFMAE